MRWLRGLSWLVSLPVAALVVVFAIANRAPVPVNLWPWPWVAEIPAFLLVLGSFALGLILGALWMGLRGLRHVLAARRLDHEATRLRRALDDSQSRPRTS